MCFDALKTYGKEPEQLYSVKKFFHFALADYPWEIIRQAFAVYIKTHTEMPTPADIVSIIERNGKPPLSQAVYINLTKKRPEERTSDEWRYIREYEEQQV